MEETNQGTATGRISSGDMIAKLFDGGEGCPDTWRHGENGGTFGWEAWRLWLSAAWRLFSRRLPNGLRRDIPSKLSKRLFYGLVAKHAPPGAAASTNFCTAGAGISNNCALGFFACSITASCCDFHESDAGCPLAMASSAASPAAPSAERSCDWAATSFTRNER